MKGVIELQIWQLAAAYIFIIILIGLVKLKGIPREKQITIATLRMTIQLVLVAYILTYIFENSNPFYTIAIITSITTFAIFNIYKRVNIPMSKELKQVAALSMIAGSLGPLLLFIFVIIGHDPWYAPQYIVPIAGMLIGNAMTGISLGANSFLNNVKSMHAQIEGALMLGATPKQAAAPLVRDAFDSAILPTINSMVGMGIITLPGMMTGQILSGISPLTAIQYQIAITLGISGSTAFSVIIFLQLGYKTFFNRRCQLKQMEP
ncbi:iron export ABC transporter permease subunit FetB [Bacillus sp. DX1.1]|uniref:ABC transporter permease n=1 Tax=unclassified Bacillus (in: firmicutes) TaxID=185979 RepID=UPI002570806A|nr:MULTISPECIES: iron export ABC transporter permease subunit FetB [unclassified Bacillus (in: firmicutes)]MDM5157068.1 iron export ABC transporter permease subunit FetB [Bacillus sp. DX1.1]WJE81304.1 iron export ABC transporter permease subunit FetB [Bacillus sp. DX3.1]